MRFSSHARMWSKRQHQCNFFGAVLLEQELNRIRKPMDTLGQRKGGSQRSLIKTNPASKVLPTVRSGAKLIFGALLPKFSQGLIWWARKWSRPQFSQLSGVSEGRLGSHLPGGEEKPKIGANIFWPRRNTNPHLCGMAASQAPPSAGVQGVWYCSAADFLSLAYRFAFRNIKHQLRNAFVVVIPRASWGAAGVISAWWAPPCSIINLLSAFSSESITKIVLIRLKEKMISWGSIWRSANGLSGSERCISSGSQQYRSVSIR